MKSLRVLAIASSLIFLSIPALGQVVTGTYPFGPFAGGPDTVNLGTLNASWTIPIVNKAGRGQNFAYNLNYDSSVYYPVTSGSSTSWEPVQNWGWQGLSAAGFVYATYKVVYSSGTCGTSGQYSWQSWVYSNLTYSDQNGVSHFFTNAGGTYISATGTTACPPSGASPSGRLSTPASDGSGIVANFITSSSGFSTTITLKNGNTIYPPMFSGGAPVSGSYASEDTNGNEITSSDGTYTDTLGQTALAVVGSAPSNTTLSYQNPAGSYVDYTVSYQSYNIKTNFGCSGISEYAATGVDLVHEITLPDGRAYQFTYEATPGYSGYVTGRPASIVLPTGGTISYTYTGGSQGINCADGSASGLDRTTPDGTWTYTRTTNSSSEWTTTVLAPAYNGVQDKTVSTFLTNESTGTLIRASFYEIERQLYSGSSPGTLLETILTCYETNTSNCSSTVGDSGTIVAALTNIQGTTQWPNSSGISAGYVDTYDTSGDNLTNAVYDYGSSGTFGSLLETTTTTYTGSYGGEKPSQITITDAGSNTISETKYNYSTSVVATSGTPQHISGYNPGNLSSVQMLVSGTTFQTKSYTYYDTGNVDVATDVNGEQTTYTYGSGTSCGNSFPTQVSSTTGGSVVTALTTSATWNCVGGVQLTNVDANGNTTTNAYGSDPYWRPVSVTNNATGAVTDYTYQTSSANSSSTAINFNGSSSTSTSVTTYDGLGRPLVQQTLQAPGGSTYDTVATAYDTRGRVQTQTLPYSGALGSHVPTNPGTTTTYDALNRTTEVADSGGGTKNYTYTQNDVLVTVGPQVTLPTTENLKKRNLEYNGAGWLTSVCEIISSTSPAGGSCGQTTSYTGYLTKYTYDGGRLTGVSQNAQPGSTGTQTRSISYDDLGRKLSETIPEWSGTGGTNGSTTTYTYDSASGCSGTSNGDLIKMVDNMTNTTCYTYDLLHRPTSSQQALSTSPYYSTTPLTYAVYDAATMPSSAGGATMTNAKGQVAEAYTCSTSACTTKQTDIFFSASPVASGDTAGGVQAQMWESTPHSGGYFLTQDTYYPNGAVGAISASLVGGTPGSTTNLIPDSSQVGNSSWWQYCAANQNGTGIVVDTTAVSAPDGSDTAAQYTMPGSFSCGTPNAWGGIATLAGGLTTGATYTVSAWLRGALGGESVSLGLNDCIGQGFTLTNSWQRYTATFSSIASSVANCSDGVRGFQFIGSTANSTFYIWGPQTEQASSASPYVATVDGAGTYISIPNMTFGLDGEGRPNSANDLTNGLNVVTAAGTAYNPAGLPTSITYGNAGTGSGNDVDSFTFDSNTYRPTNLTYAINPSSSPYTVTTALTWNANASLQKMVYTDGNNTALNQTCNYGADDLSRIASVGCGTSTWGQTFTYDPFGNITKAGTAGGTSYSAGYSHVTNQVSSGITPTPTYDGNGNQTQTTTASLTWNALNQPISVASTTATYDALGRMVEKGVGTTYTQFVFRPSGSILAVYSSSLVKGTVSLPGGSTAVYNASGLSYIRHKDWLGSSRLATTWNHAVYSKEAYAPFGETYNEAGTPDRSFTGQDQDVVTGSLGSGVYDYLFRKYDPSAGRWLSPDPYGWNAVSLAHPQSLNRYAYVLNNPMSLSDPMGLDCAWQNDNGSVSISQGDCPTTGPGANGVYIDANGVTTVNFDDNGNETGYAMGDQMFNPDGSGYTPDLEAQGVGFTIADMDTSSNTVSATLQESDSSLALILSGNPLSGSPMNANGTPNYNLIPGTQCSGGCHKEPFKPRPWTHDDTCNALWAIGGPPLVLVPGFDLGGAIAWAGWGTGAGAWIGGAFCLTQ